MKNLLIIVLLLGAVGLKAQSTWLRNDTISGYVQYVDKTGKWMGTAATLYDSVFVESNNNQEYAKESARKLITSGGKTINRSLFFLFVPVGYWQKF